MNGKFWIRDLGEWTHGNQPSSAQLFLSFSSKAKWFDMIEWLPVLAQQANDITVFGGWSGGQVQREAIKFISLI